MRKVLLFCLVMVLSITLFGQTEKKITILYTNDLHSRLTGFAPEADYTPLTMNDDNTIGGFARIAAIIKAEKDKNIGTTIAIDGGDFLMGTLFHTLEVETGFQLQLMKKMGYNVVCLGNHEFDFGCEKLATLIISSIEGGEIPDLLMGNVMFDKKDMWDDTLEKLYADSIIERKMILTEDNIKIGFFSILGKDADNVAPDAKPVTFTKQSSFAKKMVKELKEDNCDIIVCVSHSGLLKDENGEWKGEDYTLAQKVKGIDIIISGHTHSKLDQPIVVNGVIIVQAGAYGKFVGRLSVAYTNGNLRFENYDLIPVDDKILGDRIINQLIDEQKKKIESRILMPLGMDYIDPVVESSFLLEGSETGNFMDSNLGPMVADAIHFYVNNNNSYGTDVSMVAAGVIRDNIVPGVQTAPDIFRVMSLGSGEDSVPGYPLSRLYVTGKELKNILEILQVAYKSSPDNYCYYSGIRVEYNPDKGLLRKIKQIEILKSDGSSVKVDFSKKNKSLYSVTANSYMLNFLGLIKQMSFWLINVVPKDINGIRVSDMKTVIIDFDEEHEEVQEGKEWLALIEFLGSMKDTNGNGIPDLDNSYSDPAKCFFPVD